MNCDADSSKRVLQCFMRKKDILISSYNAILKKPSSDQLIERYKSCINFERLQPQLSMISEFVSTANEKIHSMPEK